MAMIVLEGPRALEVAAAFRAEFGWPAWDLAPDVPEVVRMDALACQTPSEAIQYVNKCAYDPELHWLNHDGWDARPMAPVEGPDSIEGVEV